MYLFISTYFARIFIVCYFAFDAINREFRDDDPAILMISGILVLHSVRHIKLRGSKWGEMFNDRHGRGKMAPMTMCVYIGGAVPLSGKNDKASFTFATGRYIYRETKYDINK